MIKNQNYYKQLYKKFINSRKVLERDGYIECHHIRPRGLGGSDDPSNLVYLTPREHFFAHLLLYKIHPTNIRIVKGLSAMAYGNLKQLNSWQYAFIKSTITKKMPPKDDLLNLYYNKNMSYKKIGILYKVSDMTVCKWFKIYSINLGKINNKNSKYKYRCDKSKVKELFQSEGVEGIMNYFQVSKSKVYEWLRECKLSPKKIIGITKPIPPKDVLYKAFTLYTRKEMALMFNVGKSLIQKWIKMYNFKK